MSPKNHKEHVIVAAVRYSSATLEGGLGKNNIFKTIMMLDSGSTISLVREDVAVLVDCHKSPHSTGVVQVVSASGEPIPILDHVLMTVHLGPLVVTQAFVVVKSLVALVILGLDFLQTHQLVLDFSSIPVTVIP